MTDIVFTYNGNDQFEIDIQFNTINQWLFNAFICILK